MHSRDRRLERVVSALLAGVLFGAGLAVAQMTNPRKVLDFLDVAGAWDPSLLVVLGAAVAVTTVGYRFVMRRPRPLFDDTFHLPGRRDLEPRLAAGAAIFGVGWALYGYCPGPALASLATGAREVVLFLAAMLLGMLLFRTLESSRTTDRSAA